MLGLRSLLLGAKNKVARDMVKFAGKKNQTFGIKNQGTGNKNQASKTKI